MTNKIKYSGKKLINNILGIFLVSLFVLSPFADAMAAAEVVADSSNNTSLASQNVGSGVSVVSTGVAAPAQAPVNSSGGSSKNVSNAARGGTVSTNLPQALTVAISAHPSEIEIGGSSVLMWGASLNAVSCSSKEFETNGERKGLVLVTPANAVPGEVFTYTVTCVDANGNTVQDSTTVTIVPAVVSVDLTANPTQIAVGGSSTLTWYSRNAVSCSSLDFYIVGGATNGSVSVTPANTVVGETIIYSINCTDITGDVVTDAVTITVVPNQGTNPVNNPIPGNPVGTNLPGTTTVNNPIPANPVGTNFPGLNIVSATLTANPSEIQVGGSSTLTWTSANAIACTSNNFSLNNSNPAVDATIGSANTIALNGSVSVTPTLAVGQSITYSITCVNAVGNTATAEATITAVLGGGGGGGGNNSGGGSGGSGGQGGGSGSNRNNGSVLGASTGPSCSYIRDFMRMDWENNPAEVMKLQSFLKDSQKLDVDVNGIFDQKTFNAVEVFQAKYKPDILTPWGHTDSTGFVYILTKKKINELHCNTVIPLTPADLQEIDSFRNYLLSVLSGNPVGGSMEETNISVWGTISEDNSSTDVEEVVSLESPEEDTTNEEATADVSNSGGFWNYVRNLFR